MARMMPLALSLLLALVGARPVDEQEFSPVDKSDPELNLALNKFMDLVSKYRIVIVGKSECEMTKRVRGALDDHKEIPHFMALDRMDEDEAWFIKKALRRWLGYWITPQIFVDGKHYGGAELLLDNHSTGLLAKHLQDIKTEL